MHRFFSRFATLVTVATILAIDIGCDGPTASNPTSTPSAAVTTTPEKPVAKSTPGTDKKVTVSAPGGVNTGLSQ